MKAKGRPVKPFTDREKEMIDVYLNSDKSAKEVAEQYHVAVSTLMYNVKKYRESLKQEKKD